MPGQPLLRKGGGVDIVARWYIPRNINTEFDTFYPSLLAATKLIRNLSMNIGEVRLGFIWKPHHLVSGHQG